MPKETTRTHITHIVVPEALIAEIDRVAGKRKRSRFVEDAVREKLACMALDSAQAQTAGILPPADYPEWTTPAKIWEAVNQDDRVTSSPFEDFCTP